ncbi:MAG: dTMP kinase [Candidatus Rehaiarchaeum fermentans]|nr:dTMP kinase [Candidatus Rehaiarchaeum fermentans]
MIVVEAIDGAGKSTITKRFSEEYNFSLFSYPDRNGIYWSIINKFLNKEISLSYEELFFIYSSDIIKDKNKWAEKSILDRYVTSTIAYQCALGFPIDLAIELANKLFPYPKAIIYIDISPEVSLSRKINKDIFENVEFLKKVREKYLFLAERNFMGKWIIIDGNKNLDDVYNQFINEVSKIL